MKLTFKGWKRQVYPHPHDITPIQKGSYSRLGKSGEALQWEKALLAKGKINNLSLNGDFRIEIEFDAEELKNWLSSYVSEYPEEAIQLLAEMQGKALIHLVQNKIDNIET